MTETRIFNMGTVNCLPVFPEENKMKLQRRNHHGDMVLTFFLGKQSGCTVWGFR
jgi:hypothetical protein